MHSALGGGPAADGPGRDHPVRALWVGRPDEAVTGLASTLTHGGLAVGRLAVVAVGDLGAALGAGDWDVVLASMEAGLARVREVATQVDRLRPGVPVVAVGPERTGPALVGALRSGARDLVVPTDPDHLVLVLEREIARRAAGAQAPGGVADPRPDSDALVLFGRFAHAGAGFARSLGFADPADVVGLLPEDVLASADAGKLRDGLDALARDTRVLIDARPARGGDPDSAIGLALESLVAGDARHFRVTVRAAASGAGERSPRPRRTLVRRLTELEQRDPLTGFHQRSHLHAVLQRALASRSPGDPRGYLLLVEVEQLGSIRRACGIDASDSLVREFAVMLRRIVPGAAAHARLADASFAFVLRGGGLERARAVAERVRAAAKEHIWDVGAHSIATACSIGVVALDGPLADADAALARADLLCRAALGAGGDRVEVDAGAAGLVPDDPTLAEALRDALREERMSVVFQPIVGLRAEEPGLYEAYLRVFDRSGSVLPAGDVFRIANAEGLTVDLDRWVMARVVATLAEPWAGGGEPPVVIKSSEATIGDAGVLTHLRRALWTHRIPGERLVLEIGDLDVVHRMHAARDFTAAARSLGCAIALAGFDGASGSRGLIRWLGPRYVKFRHELVERINADAFDLGALRSAQAIAQELGLSTIATRVQNAPSLAMLWECGVDYVQGNYLHEPSSALGLPAGA